MDGNGWPGWPETCKSDVYAGIFDKFKFSQED
jgi:hypothetical protein